MRSRRVTILEECYPNRAESKLRLEAMGIRVLTIKEAVDRFHIQNLIKKNMSKGIRVKAAIEHYNLNVKKVSEKKLIQEDLAIIVLPDVASKTAGQYLSAWNNGKKLGTLKPENVTSICEVTGVDPNFLFNHIKK